MARNTTTTFDRACSQQRASLSFLTPLFPSSSFQVQVQVLTAAGALGIYRTSRGIDSISNNNGNGRHNGVTSKGILFVRIPAVTLHAPH